MATQNPIEQEGTYALPEAQLDRFFFKILVPYATRPEMNEIVDRTTTGRVEDITPIGEVERAPFGTLHHRWEVVRRYEREGSDSLLVDHWSLAGRTSQTLRHNPEVPLECN